MTSTLTPTQPPSKTGKVSIRVSGFPKSISDVEKSLCYSRIDRAIREMMEHTGVQHLTLTATTGEGKTEQNEENLRKSAQHSPAGTQELSVEQRATRYVSRPPLYTFDQIVLPTLTLESITNAAETLSVRETVFDEWGLRKVEPFPRMVLNFFGPSGTGKTMAAHALAQRLGKKILVVSYADIESMYHGEGPKNIQALFYAAQRDDAVLFLDEADSLLSRRITNVRQGSEQAINSMRSELLIGLERHQGLVIFATNLIKNYDTAFGTRLKHVEFPLPDRDCLRRIWLVHLVEGLPIGAPREQIAQELSDIGGVCGRDVKNAVIEVAVATALRRKSGESEAVIKIENLKTVLLSIKNSRLHCEQ